MLQELDQNQLSGLANLSLHRKLDPQIFQYHCCLSLPNHSSLLHGFLCLSSICSLLTSVCTSMNQLPNSILSAGMLIANELCVFQFTFPRVRISLNQFTCLQQNNSQAAAVKPIYWLSFSYYQFSFLLHLTEAEDKLLRLKKKRKKNVHHRGGRDCVKCVLARIIVYVSKY